MAKNLCVMLTGAQSSSWLIKALSMAFVGVDLYQRTVLYVEGLGTEIAEPDHLELRDTSDKKLIQETAPASLVDMRRHFQNTGGQLWVSPFSARQMRGLYRLVPGAIAVDERTLLTFLAEDTVVITY
jgi:hypothetical protein